MCALHVEKRSQQSRCDTRASGRRLNDEEVYEVSAEEVTRQQNGIAIDACSTGVDPAMPFRDVHPDEWAPLRIAVHRFLINGQQIVEVGHRGEADASGPICHVNSLLAAVRVLRSPTPGFVGSIGCRPNHPRLRCVNTGNILNREGRRAQCFDGRLVPCARVGCS